MLKSYNYKKEADGYLPNKIKYLLIAESPPKDYKNYFYYIGDERGNYCFFQNIILAALDIKYQREIHDKKKILNLFKNKGFHLIDAVEFPINELDDFSRKKILIQNKYFLIEKLKVLKKSGLVYPKTKIILIKNLVYEVLKEFLETNEEIAFDRLYGIKCLGYPGYYSDQRFINKLKNIIS
jgi:hypothetical protein